MEVEVSSFSFSVYCYCLLIMNNLSSSRAGSTQMMMMDGLLPFSPSHKKIMSSPGDKSKSSSSLLRRISVSGRRTKHQDQAAGKSKTSSTGDLHLSRYNNNLRSRLESSFKDKVDEEEGVEKAAKSMGHFRITPLARAPSNPTDSLKNETWDEAVTTSSVPKAASFQFVKHVRRRSVNFNDNRGPDGPQSLSRPKHKNAHTTTRSTVAKHVHFADKDNEISYKVTKDDIKNSWLDVDVSGALESTVNENHNKTVSFGPTGRSTLSGIDLCKDRKEYVVLIQQHRLVNEILGQRTNLRRSVLEEQARQKRECIVNAEKLGVVSSKHSKWGVEIAKSSWWLHMSNMT